jgi:hypothetical protein
MKTKLSVIFALSIAIGFLIRCVYWFFIISLDGGIVLREPNIYISITEYVLALISVFILIIFCVSSIWDYSKKYNEVKK